MAEAEGELKKWGGFFGGNDKYEKAADTFKRAGNAYKAGKACAWGLRSAPVFFVAFRLRAMRSAPPLPPPFTPSLAPIFARRRRAGGRGV
jgi:hypothetical protein